MRLYVGNLPYSIDEAGLEEMFGRFGQVTDARVVTDRDTGQSKGFGFVELPNDDEARAAMQELDGSEVGGRTIKVNEAQPREDRGARY